MKKRFFSLQEARQILPHVKELAERMVLISTGLERWHEWVTQVSEKNSLNSGGSEGTAYVERLIGLQMCIAQLQSLGCVVKGVQEGLVDFPHLKDGREVYLCWKCGEEDIGYWHEVDKGFAGRTPLDDDSKKS